MRKLRTHARPTRLGTFLAAGLATAALGLAAALSGESGAGQAASSTKSVTVYADGTSPRGSDNRDGRIGEGGSGWNCRSVGNRACGNRIVPSECKGADAWPPELKITDEDGRLTVIDLNARERTEKGQ
ncbi:hypothetical protein [Streptomyces sp. NRRL S-920]|uniref:hypothetical protein n=1 Tax=Streptomyces sp. NRRL S-920 TaxID=1463921 RepID=UPI0004CBF23D|nr:hypothetical protein [Streptomyces sp. NRRL S-920]